MLLVENISLNTGRLELGDLPWALLSGASGTQPCATLSCGSPGITLAAYAASIPLPSRLAHPRVPPAHAASW